MIKFPKVLITGVSGFIGKNLRFNLQHVGCEVWGIGRKSSSKHKNYLKVDLLDIKSVLKAEEHLPEFTVLIHTAAIAHGENPPKGETVISNNLKITENVLKVFGRKIKHFIFLSSISVYGEDKRTNVTSESSILRPSSMYGLSKKLCEKLVIKSKIKNYTILRLCPVYSDDNKIDIRKRVFLPFLPFVKINIFPVPFHSLTHLNTLNRIIKNLVFTNIDEKRIFNICDSKPYSQKDLVKWFKGPSMILPVILVKPFYWLSFLLPEGLSYKVRCNFWKLFCNNIYSTGKLEKFNYE